MPARIPAPWVTFLRDVDRALDKPVEVHCLGGFVLAILWDLPRPTGDVDFVEVVPSEASEDLHAPAVVARVLRDGPWFSRVTGTSGAHPRPGSTPGPGASRSQVLTALATYTKIIYIGV
jgi:hypothetical protein